MILFSVTYEIWDESSLEHGETDDKGLMESGLGLRDAVRLVQQTRTSLVDGCEVMASDSDIGAARWITVSNGMEFETGDHEIRAIHFPDCLTASTRKRIAKLLGAYGAGR